MNQLRQPTVDDVVRAVEEELDERVSTRPLLDAEPTDPGRKALDLAIALQRSFRADPVGGRLVVLKRVAYWFLASSFDRQAKVVEAMLPALEAVRGELVALRREVSELRERGGGSHRAASR